MPRLALILLPLLAGCNLLNPGVPCEGDENCFSGFVCAADGTCVDPATLPARGDAGPAPDAGQDRDAGPGVDAGPGLDGGPDLDAGPPPECAPLGLDCDAACFDGSGSQPIFADDFSAFRSEWCVPPNTGLGSMLASTAVLDLGLTPANGFVRVRALVDWNPGGDVSFRFNTDGAGAPGTGFRLSEAPEGPATLTLERAPGREITSAIESPGRPILYLELRHEPIVTYVTVSRFGFVGEAGSALDAVLVLGNDQQGPPQQSGELLVVRAGGGARIQRMSVDGHAADDFPLGDSFHFVDTFTRVSASGAPELPFADSAWGIRGDAGVVEGVLRCGAPCALDHSVNSASFPFVLRANTLPDDDAQARARVILNGVGLIHERDRIAATYVGVDGGPLAEVDLSLAGTANSLAFHEVHVDDHGAMLVSRGFSQGAILGAAYLQRPTRPLRPGLRVDLSAAALEQVTVEPLDGFDGLAVELLDDFEEPDFPQLSLIPHTAWSATADGGVVEGPNSIALPATTGRDVAARFELAPAPDTSFSAQLTTGAELYDFGFDTATRRLSLSGPVDSRELTTAGAIPVGQPLFAEARLASPNRSSIVLRTGSFAGPVVSALEMQSGSVDPRVIALSFDTAGSDDAVERVEFGEIVGPVPTVLSYTSFDEANVTRTALPDAGIAGASSYVFDEGFISLEGNSGGGDGPTAHFRATEPIGVDFRLRAKVVFEDAVDNRIVFHFNHEGLTSPSPDLSFRISPTQLEGSANSASFTVPFSPIASPYFIEVTVRPDPDQPQLARFDASVSTIDYGAAALAVPGGTFFVIDINDGAPLIPPAAEFSMSVGGDAGDVRVEELILERAP